MKSLASDESDSSSEDLKKRFLQASFKIQAIGKAAGYRIIPTTDLKLPYFSGLTHSKQLQAVTVLERSCEIYGAVIGNGDAVNNPNSVVWSAFRSLNLVPPSNFFDKLSSEDVIQIYSMEGFHLFANFRFFELCSYTLEQIYSLQWTDLWSRDAEALTELQGVVARALGPDQTEAVTFDEPPHRVRELISPFKYELSYSVKGIAPVWHRKPHQKAGFIIIERGQILNPIEPAQEEKILSEFYQVRERGLQLL